MYETDCFQQIKQKLTEFKMPKALQQNYPPYTCLMSVYSGDDPASLCIAVESMTSQTIPPDELVLVIDGPISNDLEEALSKSTGAFAGNLRIIRLPQNKGLWHALQVGIEESTNELIMRMDSDDYSVPSRAEIQLTYMQDNPNCDCCGSIVTEFKNDINNVICTVELPENHDDIVAFSKRRDPIRHPALLYKKSDVIRCGNYQEMPYFEDYDLVVRMIDGGCVFHNLQEPLVRVRVSDDFYQRRGDAKYLKSMWGFRKSIFSQGYISFAQFIFFSLPHAIVCLLPNNLRKAIYMRLLRKQAPKGDVKP